MTDTPSTDIVVSPGSQRLVGRVFLSALGVIFAIAFLSAWVQIEALVGEHGIWPARDYLSLAEARLGWRVWLQVPTLLLLWPRDPGLHLVCAAGLFSAIGLVLGLAPRLLLVSCWALYLSICSAGGVFFAYQWDQLLLETAFLALFFAPPGLRPRLDPSPPPSRIATWLLRWLLFRLMFLAGVVKLTGEGDKTAWKSLTALDFHFATQPLPTRLGYLMHQLPHSAHAAFAVAMLFIELGVPLFLFAPRRLRLVAAALITALQLLIIATGNYAFFNWLTIVLCLPLLDDAALLSLFPRRLRSAWSGRIALVASQQNKAVRAWRRAAMMLVTAFVLAVSGAGFLYRVAGDVPLPGPLSAAIIAVEPFHTINLYGLFEEMSLERQEIVLEGSRDAKSWRPYRFRWKPGPLDRMPGLVAPHDPRVDFQMWFAAHGDSCRQSPWLLFLLQRLMEGSRPVAAIFEANPFPEGPPRFMRAFRQRYRFTKLDERREGGAVWALTDGEMRQVFCPVMQVKAGLIVDAWDFSAP